MKKKLFAVLLASLLIVTLLPTAVLAISFAGIFVAVTRVKKSAR